MAERGTAAALRDAIFNYAQASADCSLSERAGLDKLGGTETRMRAAWEVVNAEIDATALTLAADMVEGLRQIINMIDSPHFDENRKCRIRGLASDLVGRAEALSFSQKPRGEEL